MTSLRELQERCYRAFIYGDSASLLPAVRDSGVPAAQRIEVYQNNAREIYRKTLAASYPVIERLVGEDCFAALALKYMREHPSRSGDLQRFGAAFGSFLGGVYGDSQFAYLHDIARLEWALEEVHLEPDEAPLDPAALGDVPADRHQNLTFVVRKALRLVRSPYPVLSIWRANQPGRDGTADLQEGGQCVAVLRRGDDLEMHALDENALALTVSLAGGASLRQAFEAINDDSRDAEPDFAAALQSVMRLGLLTGFALPEPEHSAHHDPRGLDRR